MEIPETTYQHLINYLAGRPWKEVARLMGELAQAQEAHEAQEASGDGAQKKTQGGSKK